MLALPDPPEPLAEQIDLVLERVAHGADLLLADALAVGDGDLEEPPVADRLRLELLGERHAVAAEIQAAQEVAAEHPHPGLAVADAGDRESVVEGKSGG